jgi:hypothetical protein
VISGPCVYPGEDELQPRIIDPTQTWEAKAATLRARQIQDRAYEEDIFEFGKRIAWPLLQVKAGIA